MISGPAEETRTPSDRFRFSAYSPIIRLLREGYRG